MDMPFDSLNGWVAVFEWATIQTSASGSRPRSSSISRRSQCVSPYINCPRIPIAHLLGPQSTNEGFNKRTNSYPVNLTCVLKTKSWDCLGTFKMVHDVFVLEDLGIRLLHILDHEHLTTGARDGCRGMSLVDHLQTFSCLVIRPGNESIQSHAVGIQGGKRKCGCWRSSTLHATEQVDSPTFSNILAQDWYQL